MKSILIFLSTSLILSNILFAQKNDKQNIEIGNVIFIHPDGSGAAKWNAFRILEKGPDGMLAWDKFEKIGLYRGHIKNALSTSSNAGATAHAFGIKADYNAFGINPKKKIKSLSGKNYSIMEEAKRKDKLIGLVNSGHICEPGTAVFLANAEARNMTDTISEQLIRSGAKVLFSGGEVLLLPKGIKGKHGKNGTRKDGKNLIELAQKLGYKVIYTRSELLSLPLNTPKVLGIFSAYHTFNDFPEEENRKNNLPDYNKVAPTVGEMTDVAIKLLNQEGKNFFLVVEEEGSDNFSNNLNARGTFEALRRADDAYKVSMDFINKNDKTLLITCSDSEAGGMQIESILDSSNFNKPLYEKTPSGAAIDGIDGTSTNPFISKPDKNGRCFQFGVSWATSEDVFGGVIAKAHGLNSFLLKNNVDNTDIYRVMYATLFGRLLP